MCTPCRDYYVDALSKPLKGIDRPEGADDDWRGSIMEHIRHASIAMAFELRNESPSQAVQLTDDFWSRYWTQYEKNYTPAQRQNALAWRKGLRELAASRTAQAKL